MNKLIVRLAWRTALVIAVGLILWLAIKGALNSPDIYIAEEKASTAKAILNDERRLDEIDRDVPQTPLDKLLGPRIDILESDEDASDALTPNKDEEGEITWFEP